MSNGLKVIIGIIVLALVGYAIFAFDIGRERDGNPKPDTIGGDISDMIRVLVPKPETVITSPATFSGEARGTWFFEATFPIDILGDDGTVIGRGYAEAQDEWMTEEFVPWTAIIQFDPKGYTEGLVRFMKDNPSGLPENDASIEVPVKFSAASNIGSTAKSCRPTGCSSQICSDEDIASTCEFRPEYACYKNGECKRQANGQCGWTQSAALLACLNNPPQIQ
jgi:hypothetical protein